MLRIVKRVGPILVMVSTLLLLFPCYCFTKATPTGTFDVFAPTANSVPSVKSTVLYPNEVKKLDGLVAHLMEDGAWVSTQGFLNPSYDNYWPPYSNRSAFPPANATMLSISMLTIIRCQVPRSFQMHLVFTIGDTSFNYFSGWLWAGPTDQAFTFNITTNLVTYGKEKAWDYFTIFLDAGPAAGGKSLYVDYLGISALWTWPGPPAGPGGTGYSSAPIDVIGLMGMTGFIGMIGIPAISIWMFRRDGGSKIYAAVMALVAFLVCFGFFLASINGG